MIKNFAEILDNVVINVIVSEDNLSEDSKYIEYKEDGSIRYNSAKIGSRYLVEHDAFIDPQEFMSWILNEETFKWEPPIPKPEGIALWVEEDQRWHQPNN